MILEALASFNKWWFDVIVVNAGYWFLLGMGIVVVSLLSKVKIHVKTKTREDILKEQFHETLRKWKEQNKDFDIPK
jgi:hypothetical protein